MGRETLKGKWLQPSQSCTIIWRKVLDDFLDGEASVQDGNHKRQCPSLDVNFIRITHNYNERFNLNYNPPILTRHSDLV